MKNQFEILCEKLMSGNVMEGYFIDEMKRYLEEVYSKAISHNQTAASLTPSTNVISMPSNSDLEEMAVRIMKCIYEGASSFIRAQDKSKVREFTDQQIEDYDVFFCEEQKFDLGKVTDPRARKAINMVLGLDSQTIFVQIATTKTNGLKSEVCMSTTAVPREDDIICYDRKGNGYGPYGMCYEDSICCSRFDASHMEVKNTNGAKKPDHINDFYKVGLLNEEFRLYSTYFKNEAPCPHFHYYKKQVCWDKFSNDYSFAINIKDLLIYLKDLEFAIQSNDKSNPILKYSLGMPFLGIAKGEISCDISPFITTARNILAKYDTKTHKDDIIYELYDDLLKTRRAGYGYRAISQMTSAINFMCGVSEYPIETVVDVPSGQYLEKFTEVNQKRTDAALTALAARVQESVGETLNEKTLHIEKRNFEDTDQKNQ